MLTGIFDYFLERHREDSKFPLMTPSGHTGKWQRIHYFRCFPGGSVVKNPPANPGDTGLIPDLGRPPGEGDGTPLQYSCLEKSMDRVGYSPWAHKELDMTEQLAPTQ